MATLMMVALPLLGSSPIVVRETEKALLIEVDDNNRQWFPKSQVRGFFSTQNGVWLVTTPFMVKEKGLTYRSQRATENDLHDAMNNNTGAWL